MEREGKAGSSPGAVDTPTDCLQQGRNEGCVCVGRVCVRACVWRGVVTSQGSLRVRVESCGAARHKSAEWRGGQTVRGPPPKRGRGPKEAEGVRRG
jgi:hypothetical protein